MASSENLRKSGVYSLPELPSDWKWIPLKYLCEISAEYGLNISSDKYSDDGVRFIRISDLDSNGNLHREGIYLDRDLCRDYLLKEGDLLISRSGATVGKSYRYKNDEGPCAFASYLVRFRLQDEMNSKFVYYYLKSKPFEGFLKTESSGATITNVSGRKFARLQIPTPPREKQDRVVSFLNARTKRIDTLIEKKQTLRDRLEEKQQSTLTQAVIGGLDQGIESEQTGVDWLGKLPLNWDTSPLKYQVSIKGGKTPKKSEAAYWDGDIPWFSAKDMDSEVLEDSEDHITERALVETQIPLLPPESIIVVVRGMILDHTFPVGITSESSTINQDMKALKTGNNLKPQYLLKLLKGLSPAILAMTEESAHGTKRLDVNQLKELEIPVPPIKEQEEVIVKIEDELNQIEDLKAKTEDAINLLQEKRQAIITSAVTGQIDLSDWQPPDEQEALA